MHEISKNYERLIYELRRAKRGCPCVKIILPLQKCA